MLMSTVITTPVSIYNHDANDTIATAVILNISRISIAVTTDTARPSLARPPRFRVWGLGFRVWGLRV